MTDEQKIKDEKNSHAELDSASITNDEKILKQVQDDSVVNLDDLKKQNEECLNKWKRALADYDNLKKETAREKTEMAQFARGLAAMEFLEVYENLKKAFGADFTNNGQDNTDKWENWKQGIGHVKNQFAAALKQMGIEEIKTVGEKFDPNLHEAVSEEATEGKESGIIIREVEGGYRMGEKVIKAAKVIVAT